MRRLRECVGKMCTSKRSNDDGYGLPVLGGAHRNARRVVGALDDKRLPLTPNCLRGASAAISGNDTLCAELRACLTWDWPLGCDHVVNG